MTIRFTTLRPLRLAQEPAQDRLIRYRYDDYLYQQNVDSDEEMLLSIVMLPYLTIPYFNTFQTPLLDLPSFVI